MPSTVVTRLAAKSDLRQNAAWLARRFSRRSSARWLTGIEAAISTLADRPEQHPEADEAADLGVLLRYKSNGRRPHVFRVLFTVDGDTVTVLRVLHAAQGPLTEDDL